jgi:hypothetical protein
MDLATYKRQPYQIAMARSPMIYIIHSSTAATSNLPYTLNVNIWRGATGASGLGETYPLKRYPDKNGNGVFDISSIVSGYFGNIPYALPNETTDTLAVNVKVYASYIDATGAPVTPTLSNIIQAQYGWNRFTDDINQVIPEKDNGWLTDIPDEITLPRDAKLSLFVRNTSLSTWAGWRASADTGGSSSNFRNTPNPPASSEQTLLNFKVGPADLSSGFLDAINAYYDIILTDGSSTAIGKPVRVWLEPVCKYPTHKVDFINSFGVWDRFVFYGASRVTTDTTDAKAMRHVDIPETGDSWRVSAGQFVKYNKQGIEKTTVNTGWVSEKYNIFFEQMMLSDRVVFDGNAAILTDSSKQWKTDVNDGMINYEFTFESAFTTINSVF